MGRGGQRAAAKSIVTLTMGLRRAIYPADILLIIYQLIYPADILLMIYQLIYRAGLIIGNGELGCWFQCVRIQEEL